MVDEVASTALVYDARGAEQGAARFAASSEKIIDAAKRTGAAGLAAASEFEKATTRVAGESLKQARSFDALARRIDPFGQAVRDATRDLERLQAEAAGTGQNALRAAELVATAQAKVTAAQKVQAAGMGEVTRQTGAASSMMRQFGIQSFDVFSSLSAGAPVMTVFIQQGAQIAQVAAAQGGAFAALGQVVRSVFAAATSPVGLAIGATAALAAGIAVVGARAFAMADETRAIGVAISAVGRSAELSATQLQKYVATLNQAGVARSDAAAIVSSLARVPGLSSADIGRVSGIAANAATALGVDPAAAAKDVGAAAAGSLAAITKLDDALNFLTRDQRQQIRVMAEYGDAMGAAGIATEALQRHVDGARERSLGPFERAWDSLTNAINRSIDAAARAKFDIPLAIISPLGALVKSALTSPDAAPTFRQAETQSLAAGTAERERQGKIVDELNKKLAEENRILSAGVGARGAVRAEIEAGRIAAEKGLDVENKRALTMAMVAKANREAADSAIQEAAATDRQIKAAVMLTSAALEGRTVAILGAAAAEAHDKAATQAGVSENAWARAIANRRAAQGAQTAAENIAQMDAEIEATRRFLGVTSEAGRLQADLANKLAAATRELDALEGVTTRVDVLEAIMKARDATIERVTAQHNLNVQLREQGLLLQHQESSLTAVTNTIGNAFDRLGQSIVDAFVSGQGAAVNFGNVLRGIAASVLTDFVKLGAINPILNAIVPSSRGPRDTLSAAFGGGGGQSLIGQASNLSSLAGLSDALGITSIKDTLLGWGNSLGITGGNGLFGGVTSLLNTPIFGSAFAANATNSAIAASGVYGPAQLSGLSALGSTSIGSLLGGIGGGFGLGSLGGGLLQGAIGKTGPAPTIGAGLGSVGGALLGSIIPGIGTVLGGIFGGALGGGAGGLIGPQKASSFSSTGLGISATGGLDIGQTVSQIADTTAELAQLQAQVAQINQLLAASGAVITSLGGVSQIGQNTPGGFQDPSKAAGLDTAFSGLRFSAPGNDILNRQISDRSFASAQELAAATQKVKNFVDVVVPALKRLGELDNFGIGTLSAGLEEIKAQFVGAIATAQKLGYAENDLVAARERALTVAQSNALQAFKDIDVGLSQRQMNATAIITGKPEDAMAAALVAFDAAADAQRKQLNDSLLSLLGDAGKTHILYTDRMVLLEKTLGEERLAVSKQYNDAIAANQNAAAGTASGVIRSITDYARGLQFGSESPLSATSQLNAATMQFDAVRGAAAAGDFNSAQQLTGFAETLRTAARNVFGSGVGYVDVIKKITDALEPISTMAPERLITSVMTTEIRSQTQTLSADLMDLKTAINQVRDSIRAGSGAPPASRAA